MSKETYPTMDDIVDFTMLEAALTELEATSRGVKAERDEAVRLLRECLTYSTLGDQVMFKTKVRDFLDSLGTRH